MSHRSRWLFGSLFAVWAFAGSAAAQTPSGTVDVKTNSAVSPAEQMKLADAWLVRMKNTSDRVRHLLDDARRLKDVVKTICLNDKVNQLEVALKSGRERRVALTSAINHGDNELRAHEFSVLAVLRQRTERLDAEANLCIGEEMGFPGETRMSINVDPNIAPYEPGAGGGEVIGGGTQPPEVIPPQVVVSPSR